MHISNYPLTILFYKYGHPYLTYLPQKFLFKLFFGKNMAQKYPTYLQFGHMCKINTVPFFLKHPVPQNFLSKLFLEKVWLRNTLPTYNLDICPKYRIFLMLSLGIFQTNLRHSF